MERIATDRVPLHQADTEADLQGRHGGAPAGRCRRMLLATLTVVLTVAPGVGWAQSAPAEQTVRTTLESYWVAGNSGDADRFLPYYADDAKIDSLVAGGKVPKAEFATAMRKWLQTPANRDIKARYRITKVAFPSPTRAVVDTDQEVSRAATFSQSGFSRSRSIQWVLEERDGKWLIVETTTTKR
jgi:uncharacterized protein (TIGR02246 family)